VILRYVGCPYPPESGYWHALPGFVVGELYEVAEIYEMDGHLMVRAPGAARWPAPGEWGFGIHPEWFSPTSEPIPIISCGFYYNEFLIDFFGVTLQQRAHVDLVRLLDAVDYPEDDELFESWRARAAAALPPECAEPLFRLQHIRMPLHMGVAEQVFLADEGVGRSFAYVGTFLADLARRDMSRQMYAERLAPLLRAMGVQEFEIREVNLTYWQGTHGGDRLINAPPDGRLIYGTDNEPLSSERERLLEADGENHRG
jgi:hypothetical protein